MAKLGISTGSTPNDGTGDSLLSGAIKINSNFNEIYSAIGDGTNITNRIAYATTAGFSTTSGYATTSGTANYSAVSGVSTYSSLSGIASASNYANTSGISTVAQFAQNLTGTPNISAGVITASSYFGSGANLSGIITSIQAGSNVSVAITGSVATISATGTGGGSVSSQWLSVVSGIVTSSNVGIGTTIANSALQVNNGTISLTGTPGSNVAISLRDNHRLTFGDSGTSDSSVFFDGTELNIRTSGAVNISDNSGRDVFSAVAGEGAILYYDNSKKFQTLTDGAYVDGNLGVLGIVTATRLRVSGVSTFSYIQNTGITSTRDLIIYGNGNESGSISTVALMSRNNYIDFGPAIENTSAPQQFALRFGSNRATGTFGLYNILGASYSAPSGSVFLNNWDGTSAISISDNGVFVTPKPLIVGAATSTGNASQTLQVTGGAYISGAVGIGTTNLVDGYDLTIGVSNTGIRTTSLRTYGYANINGLTVKGNSRDYTDNVIITQNPSATFYGNRNVAIGDQSFTTPGAAGENVAIGYYALNVVGNNDGLNTWNGNTAVGAFAGQSVTTTLRNTFIGNNSGRYITTGGENTILGSYDGNQKGLDIRTSSNNVVISDGAGNIRLYANSSGNVGIGTTNATSTLTVGGGIQLAQNNTTIVGTSGTTGEIKRIGGAPFFYDGIAWREFVLSSGTPVSVPADTEWDNVILRSTFDTNFDDVRFSVSPTVSVGSTITQSAVKIGTGSLRLQNGYLTYPHRSEYNFTGEWTIEGWFYIDTLPSSTGSASDVIFSKGNPSTSSNNFALGLEYAGISNLYNFYWKNNASTTHNGARGTVIAQYAGTNLIKQWIHIALVREPSNGSIHFYLNGIEHGSTASNAVIDNDISNTPTNDMYLGYYQDFTDSRNFDGYVDDFRISTVARYTSVGITTTTTFTPPTTALPTTGTLSSYIQPPADKYGEITLGVSPTWRGTSGVTVSRQASGNYRVSFASSYTNRNDYYVLSQGMDQGFASYVGIARSTTHVDISINRIDNNATIDSGSLSVQIKNHI